MTNDQISILIILLATVGMFLWGRWRHDMVAVGGLLACVIAGLVPANEAFVGFGHPAVVTVAAVLVLSRGLRKSGAVNALTRAVLPPEAGISVSLATLLGLGALLSSFMNNVGAMALLMPVAIQVAKRLNLAPGQALMPLAFGTILGGMMTLIGTPPNVIVSGFRAETGAGAFSMFAFTPIGLPVAAAGVAFVALVGWRLVPARKQTGAEGFESGAYITEARVPEDSKAVDMSLREMEAELDEFDAQIIGMVRQDIRLSPPSPWRKARVGDILVLEAEAEALTNVLSALGLKLEDAVKPSDNKPSEAPVEEKDADAEAANARRDKARTTSPSEFVLAELAVLPGSPLTGRSATDILLRTRYGLNLLGLSRQGRLSMKRLRTVRFRSGDLLLIQGAPEAVSEFAADNGCVPLAERALNIPDKRRAWQAGAVMGCSVACAALGLLPAAVSFAAGVLASMALGSTPPRTVYEAIDWPVITLLAALIPVAGAMEATGAADLIAQVILDDVAQGRSVVALTLLLVVTMFLSDLMNNAATAAVMCPIALGIATGLDVNADPFLMAVAIGASCAFLTPIGHQNNTLILGPGGFRFGDYWKLGLPMEILVIAIAIPLILVVWPL